MAKVLIREGVGGAAWLPRWNAQVIETTHTKGRVLTEEARTKATDVAAFGLSPNEYIAVIETDLGVSGKVNLNGRIYPTPRYAGENMRLAAEVTDGKFSPAEYGHPDGMATLNVAARLIEVWLEDGAGTILNLDYSEATKAWSLPEGKSMPRVAKAAGRIAFLKTEQGKNAFVLYKAGMDLGMSSVSYGEPVPHKINEKSPYAADNADHMGRTVDLIEAQDLVRYDVVGDPSAGTFMRASEARAAYESLRATITDLPPILTEAREATKGETMDLKTLKAEHPDLYKQIVDEAAKAAPVNPLAGLSEADQKRAVGVVQALGIGGAGTTPPTDDALLAKVAEMVAPVRARLTTLEEANKAETSARKAAEQKTEAALAEVAKFKEREVEREAKEARAAALTEAVGKVHKNLQGDVRSLVERQIAKGQITTKEQIAEAVADTEAAFKAVSKRTVEQTGATVAASTTTGATDDNASAAGGTAELSFEDQIAEAAIAAAGGRRPVAEGANA